MVNIEKSLEVFFEKNVSDEGVVNKLLELGFTIAEAERIAIFAPITFGREIINSIADVIYPEEFEVEVAKDSWFKIIYTEEPIYNKLKSIAELTFKSKSLSKDNFYAIANRSWELSGINQVLHDLEEKSENLDTTMLNGTKLSIMKIWGYDSLLPKKKSFIGNIISKISKKS